MIFTKEIAQKVLDIIKSDTGNNEYYDKLKEAFENDPIWYVIALAWDWSNDLQGWCEAVINETTNEFFITEESIKEFNVIP